MLDAVMGPEFGFQFSSGDTGTSVTPGASNAEGSYTQVASSGNIAEDVYWMEIRCDAGATSAAAKNQLLDVGVDPAGGTSYTAVISNLIMGCSASLALGAMPRVFQFPLFIKVGSSVAVRIQGSSGTAGTVLVRARFWGRPNRPENAKRGSFSETIGTITNSSGVAFTPGTGSKGSWASLGTTTRDLWWWQLGVGVDDTTMSNQSGLFDLAYGDATNKVIIIPDNVHLFFNTEAISNEMQCNCFKRVPGGSTLYVRGSVTVGPDSNYSAVAVGMGG